MRKLSTEEILRISVEEFKNTEKLPIVVVLNDIRSHHNTGAIFRTCDAFACEAVYLCGITGIPPHRDIHKTALGATETVKWKYFQNIDEIVNILKEQNYSLIALEIAENSIKIEDFSVNHNEKIALIVGNEVNGIDQNVLDLCDKCIEIPQFGTKHSLNVSVSCGIALWKISSEFRK
ncbi:MAG: RNA methyltransferase [Bacteroidales bacterium]|jgi:tRNA G18 (ribose-2'-O)-methylase SpoU|nr:RNA methyltransferase [Bacteroidales bacterium]